MLTLKNMLLSFLLCTISLSTLHAMEHMEDSDTKDKSKNKSNSLLIVARRVFSSKKKQESTSILDALPDHAAPAGVPPTPVTTPENSSPNREQSADEQEDLPNQELLTAVAKHLANSQQHTQAGSAQEDNKNIITSMFSGAVGGAVSGAASGALASVGHQNNVEKSQKAKSKREKHKNTSSQDSPAPVQECRCCPYRWHITGVSAVIAIIACVYAKICRDSCEKNNKDHKAAHEPEANKQEELTVSAHG